VAKEQEGMDESSIHDMNLVFSSWIRGEAADGGVVDAVESSDKADKAHAFEKKLRNMPGGDQHFLSTEGTRRL
jgi:hypothetical protein